MANTEHTVNSTGTRLPQRYVIHFKTRKTPSGQLKDHSSTLSRMLAAEVNTS